MFWLPLKEHLTFKRGKMFFLFTVSSEELQFFLRKGGTAASVNALFNSFFFLNHHVLPRRLNYFKQS